ncbi:cysteine-rich CWC family protein [Thalassotalea sp. 1_MG-2023]|uniref:cysteine-rich CWC family protein n=1 Tax=Thalassotalea sp. 1_MG-2023 TaxID=3062680 RepID=UPI0026E4888B|nr:cysteine-rich CWC family protein [Thalassotalea sp. 1_MG-2023]MDO6428534.1 cysteine-rich CWC family protein [Thalassotalea sp. 1_MG-2023]
MLEGSLSICPLCQQHNRCDVDGKEPCWCVSTNIPKALLANVPKNKKNKVCICAKCVEKYHVDLAQQVK